MSRRIATLGLQGPLLRYAEVDLTGDPTLRRLGTIEFDGDAERTLLGDGHVSMGPALERAAREVFDIEHSGAPDALIVAAHPSHAISFTSPLPATLPADARHEQLRQEAALLADVPAGRPVRIRAEPVREQPNDFAEPHVWHHVLYLGEPVHARLSLLSRALGVSSYDLIDTTQAVARIVSRLHPNPDPERVALAVGVYSGHTEISLIQGREWLYGHHGLGASAEDTAFVAMTLLERLGFSADAPERIFVYGDDPRTERLSMLRDMLDAEPELVDPLVLFARRPAHADPAQLASFAPLLGVTLDA